MLGEFGEVRGCRKGWILKALIRVKGFYLLIIYLLWLLLGMILFHSRPWSITEEVILESQGIFEGRQLAIYIGFFFFFRSFWSFCFFRAPPVAYTTATAMQDWSCVCHLHHSSRQRCIRNPLSEAMGQTHILMDASRVCKPLSHVGNSHNLPYSKFFFST